MFDPRVGIQSVVRVGQPEIVEAGRRRPFAGDVPVLPEPQILNIPPAELVSQAELIVRAGIDGIERVVVSGLGVPLPEP
jgi:hypothetical protein